MACDDVELLSDDDMPPVAEAAQLSSVSRALPPVVVQQPLAAGIDILSDDDEAAAVSTDQALQVPGPVLPAVTQQNIPQMPAGVPVEVEALSDSQPEEPLADAAAAAGMGGDSEDEGLMDLVQAAPEAQSPPPPVADAQPTPAGAGAAVVVAAKRAATPAGAAAPPGKVPRGETAAKVCKPRESKGEMEAKVLAYMQQQNRPYNVQNVFDNLHGTVPKAQVQQLLDSLSATGRLFSKEYGKSRVYLSGQQGSSDRESLEGAAEALQQEVGVAEESLREARRRVEEVRQLVLALRNDCALATQATRVSQDAQGLEKRLADLQAQGGQQQQLDQADIAKAELDSGTAHKEWKRRKYLCMEMLLSFSERTDMRVEALIERYAVDTDEACEQLFPAGQVIP